MKLKTKTIWITGASSGIGASLAKLLSKKDCNLILSARNSEKLEAIKHACSNPEKVKVLPFDLANYNDMDAVVEKALSLFPKIDILINNGGISQRSLIIETSIEVDKKLMEVDYLGTVALSKALLPHFVANKNGHYVVVTSLMGRFGSPYRSGYCGAKHALHGFFDVMRMEHEGDGIDVTLICPGFVNTNVAKNALTGDGSAQNTQDDATENGLQVDDFSTKMIKAIERKKFEAYIGRKEVLGIYLKRFFPKLLHKFVLKNKVR
ncbi:SDR family oxidoreductase [Winogradskyella maritima]|uniref:SDR family oxidoreductase n=1 Tax=Winogradskyella maritima TaxID=1517766 RepID=A0ABV8AI35_9FLAO|nr:SDR family oxidoreductase [Winogradskyella maritima]